MVGNQNAKTVNGVDGLVYMVGLVDMVGMKGIDP